MARKRNLPAVPEPERLPWERRKGETATAFSHFARYRDLGPHRSLAKASIDTKITLGRLKELSAKHDWVERAELYDDYIDRRFREERETERMRLERTDSGIAAALKGIVLRRINGSPAGVGPDGPIEEVHRLDPNTLDAGDLARVSETAVRIGRVSAGLATDFIRGSTEPSAREMLRVANDLIEISSKFIPDERQARYFSELQAYIETGRRL